jgi:methylmalonyl-CoA mutase N-terminal domain/subunit
VSVLAEDTVAGEREAARSRADVAARDPRALIGALLRLACDTRAGRNVMPALLEAVCAGATAGELAEVFRDVSGEGGEPARRYDDPLGGGGGQ